MDLSIARWTQDIKNRKQTDEFKEDNVNNNEVIENKKLCEL